jgi:hypothetical protein
MNNQSLTGLNNKYNSRIKLNRDILTQRKLSQEHPILRADSGVSPSKSRTIELALQNESSSKSEKLFEMNKKEEIEEKSNLKKSHDENVFYFSSFIEGFERLLEKIKKRVIRSSLNDLKSVPKKQNSVKDELICKSEEQILKNIDNFLFKTRTHVEERENNSVIGGEDENKKIESIEQLEGFEDVESLLRSALSKQISNKKSKNSNSKANISSQMNVLVESFRNSQRNSKGLRVSIGSSIRGSGKSIQLQVASPINAGQLMKELIFSKKHKNQKNITKAKETQNNLKKQNVKEVGNTDDAKGELIWNEASTKQSL